MSPVHPSVFKRFSTEPIGEALIPYVGRPLAVVDLHYQGDVGFPARLTQALTLLPPDNSQAIAGFFAAHPDGLVLNEVRDLKDLSPYPVVFTQATRGKRLYAIIGNTH